MTSTMLYLLAYFAPAKFSGTRHPCAHCLTVATIVSSRDKSIVSVTFEPGSQATILPEH